MVNIITIISFTLSFNFSHVSEPRRKIRSARPTRTNSCVRASIDGTD